MTTPAQIRKAALALPEVEETKVTGEDARVEFAVRGTVFATVTGRGSSATLTALPDSATSALADINGMESNHLVRQAWIAAAPEELSDPLVAAESTVAGEVGDLPKAIGNPATKALVAHGINSLDDLSGYSLDEVGSWHGVGAKAVDILRDALED